MELSRKVFSVVALLVAAGAAHAGPVNIGFTRITNNGSQNVASQFLAVLSEVPPAPNAPANAPVVVRFRFTNSAVIYSSVSEIYYDNRGSAPLSSLMTPLVQNGASFSGGSANPGDLPGGNTLLTPFVATNVFSADAQGHPSHGLDTAADWLQMDFTLAPNKNFASVVSALNSGDLRLGMHVRSIGTDANSDGFVNLVLIPLPTTAGLGLAGLGLVGLVRRRA